MPLTFEIPVFSAAAARTAIDRGATRLEVNRSGSYAAGGLTPTHAEVAAVAAALGPASTVPLRIMIRPRGAPPPPSSTASQPNPDPDFLYTDEEFRQMRADLDAFAASGLLTASRGDGFVFGVLAAVPADDGHGRGRRPQIEIDADRNRQLVQAAAPYACVFHRAFDLVLAGEGEDGEETSAAAATAAADGLAALRACGFAGVLTAGGGSPRGAVGHVDMLRQLVAAAAAPASAEPQPHPSIEIIVGGGVRSQNLGALAEGVLPAASPPSPASTPVSFHSSCLADAAAAVAKGAAGEAVDGEEVERIRRILDLL